MEYFICRYSVSTLKILFVDTTVCLFVKELRAFLKLTAVVPYVCILNTFTRKQSCIKDVKTKKRKTTQCKRQTNIKVMMNGMGASRRSSKMFFGCDIFHLFG